MSPKTKRVLIAVICAAVLLPVLLIALWLGAADHSMGAATKSVGW